MSDKFRIQPLKKLGQNFLADQGTTLKIINYLDISKNDLFLEIGPGQGIFTKEISKVCDNFIAVEFDKRVIENLQECCPKVNIINEDFLIYNFSKYYDVNNKTRVFGSIPYNITSPIIFKLIANRNFIIDCNLIIQNEVAKRMIAKCRTKEYGIYTVLMNYFADVKYHFKIPNTVFFPKPKVHSALISFKFKQRINNEINEELFINLVKASFGNRRKILKNSLSNSIFASHNFSEMSNLMTKRAEELEINDFIKLTKHVQKQIKERQN
ncbi:MAG: ribosomal RNA small subunit methyltransferase A [Ignavibacteriales bacterium]|nr:ribosomal RNA small subunit methyltransferase A [Ignavibacteriales bacterium]